MGSVAGSRQVGRSLASELCPDLYFCRIADCVPRLAKMPGPVEVDYTPMEARKGGYTGPRPEDIRKILEVMPGPGDMLDVRVLVQNRSEEAVFVDGRDVVAVISTSKLDAFYEGTSSNPEYEKNVYAEDFSGCVWPLVHRTPKRLRLIHVHVLPSADSTGQRPCYCKVTHFNGKSIDTKACNATRDLSSALTVSYNRSRNIVRSWMNRSASSH